MPDGPDGTAAAEEALARGDLASAEELGRAALPNGGSLAARLALAQALAWQGRGRDADAVMSEVDESALNESDLMAWALPQAANQFWMLDQPERATAFLRTVRAKVTSDGPAATLDALLGTFAMNAGSPERAMKIAQRGAGVAERRPAGHRLGRVGGRPVQRPHGQRSPTSTTLADRAIAAGHPGLLRFTSGFGQTTALIMSGELDRAQALAQELVDGSPASQAGSRDRSAPGGRRA